MQTILIASALTCLTAASAVASAGRSGTIEGTVTLAAADGDTFPGEGVRVTLACAGDRTPRAEVSDQHGAFRFVNLPVDTCSIDADVQGFAMRPVTAVTAAGATVEANLDLVVVPVRVGLSVGGAAPRHVPNVLRRQPRAVGTTGRLAPLALEQVELRRDGNRVDVAIAGRPFTSYHFDPAVAKPYLAPLRSAHGTVVTRGFPMTPDIAGEDRDEPHQRAMYFAHGDINGFDFWGEAAFPRWSDHPASTFGRTVFRTLDEIRSGADGGRLRATFDLVTPAGPIAEETQTYGFSGDEQSRIIDCELAIRASRGPVTMGDTKEGTFAIRVVKALDSPPGRMVNANGASGEKRIWGKRAEWVDYYGRVADEDVGIAVFDHPDNLRAPTYWHARGYGLLAANPFGIRQFTGDRRQSGRYAIAAGDTLVFRYRVLIHHGNPAQAQIAEAYRQFAAQK